VVYLLGGGDDGEPLHAGVIGDLGDNKEPGHNEEASPFSTGLEHALAVNADHLDAAAAAHDVGDLVRRVAGEPRGAHGPRVDPDEVRAEADLLDERQVLGVEHDDAAAALDVDVERRLQAVEHHAVAVLLARLGHAVTVPHTDDAGPGLRGDEFGGGVLVQVPGAPDELGGEAREDAGGSRELEVGEAAWGVAIGGVAEEEHDEVGGGRVGVVPPGDHAERERQCVTLLDRDHLLLVLLREHHAARTSACTCIKHISQTVRALHLKNKVYIRSRPCMQEKSTALYM
jgi:hypothetical protein